MNARIFTRVVRTPAHIPTFTPASWSAQVVAGPVVFKRLDLHVSPLSEVNLAMLAQANWRNINALDEFAVTMYYSATDSDYTMLAMVRCVKTIIASLNPALRITTITICNPLPTSVLRYRAALDVSSLIAGLKSVLYGLDAELSRRIAGGTLQRVLFTSHPNVTLIAGSEKARVREFFPALAAFHDVL
ncbi:uncharacterized protein PHACADRAFT_246571 [Phanerochaete carnosa HHB-10118-sp]|uniref:Uncharacterized protein n=1 Tax=Phanerochaete carnosa (strain HHB-10118-sp) TaxID=650164 RepID=K5WM87_PHACS|nr:uncharacterized protein PHACADRAFT_246571 [Phanerochaete carnosa HHB-10118-sp]EKM60555.1 hypothetical protein PHACADRAFT_246571 [Phanerochaete carnosa HHB-10118-sp]